MHVVRLVCRMFLKYKPNECNAHCAVQSLLKSRVALNRIKRLVKEQEHPIAVWDGRSLSGVGFCAVSE